jgi:hypothetical protein
MSMITAGGRVLGEILAAPAKAASTAAATSGFSGTKAILAVHRAIAARLERNRGLLSATGADHAGALGFATGVSPATTAGLFLFFGLTAWFAALRGRVTMLPEKILIVAGKRESLPAIAAHELLIFSHMSLSSTV